MDGIATDGEHLYAAVAVDIYLTLSVKKEQWKWMVLPLMESICMLLWLLISHLISEEGAVEVDGVATDGEHLYAAVAVDVEHCHLLQPWHT